MVEHASFIKFHWCSALCLLNFFYILSNFHLDTLVNGNVAEYHKNLFFSLLLSLCDEDGGVFLLLNTWQETIF